MGALRWPVARRVFHSRVVCRVRQTCVIRRPDTFDTGPRFLPRSNLLPGGSSMFDAWLSAVLLSVESSAVITLRLLKIAGGGRDAFTEASLPCFAMWSSQAS
jgi:hypothetical protein